MVQGHRRATVNATVVGSIPTRGNGILNIFTSRKFGEKWGTEVSGWEAGCLSTRFPGSPCLLCYVRYTTLI